jgi:hypothetical protein
MKRIGDVLIDPSNDIDTSIAPRLGSGALLVYRIVSCRGYG